MQGKQLWNWVIIAAVLVASGLAVYPPSEKLKLGPDLAGGTSLLYEVQVPPGANTDETVNRVIDVVRRRVDPSGVRNLIFQAEAGGRIQILMPQPSKAVVDLRKHYQVVLEKTVANDITRSKVNEALQAQGDVRRDRLAALVQGVEARKPLLDKAVEASDAVAAAQKDYQPLKDAPPTDQKIELMAKLTAAQKQLDSAMAAIDSTNVDPADLGRVLELSTVGEFDPSTRKPMPGTSPRELALTKLIADHPQRKDQINELVAAYDAYFSTKRPLDDPNDLIQALRGQGVLEFRITARADEVPDAELYRQTLKERGPRGQLPSPNFKWFAVDSGALNEWMEHAVESEHMKDEDRPIKAIQKEITELATRDPATFFMRYDGFIAGTDGRNTYLLLWDTEQKSLTEKQKGWQLTKAQSSPDPTTGFNAVSFTLDETGGGYMGELTKNNINRAMAIVLDGRVYSAPNIHSQINGSGQITGKFSPAQLSYLITTLDAGSIGAKLSDEPIMKHTVQPTLGADNLDRGLRAAAIAFIAVSAFMIGYYFFGGFVATLALTANILGILGIMALFQGTFTLPGIAGVVLTIGIAVDANVLIFERVREELRRGLAMFAALRVGYEKAFSAIIDGHVTTMITCLVLYYAGAADVKGFGLTLAIGTAASLFTSLFMTKTIFNLWYHLFPGHRMSFLPVAVPAIDRIFHRNIDWIGLRSKFYLFSGVVCIASIGLCVYRWHDMLDIEFRTGTEASFDLKEGKSLARQEVEDRLKAAGMKGFSVIVIGDKLPDGKANNFSVVTSDFNSRHVSETICETFKDVLNVQPVLQFAGSDLKFINGAQAQAANQKQDAVAPVYPVNNSRLGAVIDRPNVQDDVAEYRGGVAIVLDKISPPATLHSIEERIRAKRLSPEFEKLTYRPARVIGLQREGSGDLYTSVAVLTRDPVLNYFENPENWEHQLASVEWNVMRQAMISSQSLSKLSNFSPAVAETLAASAITSMLLAVFFIVAYVWIRFGTLRYGLAAIATVVHDVIVAMGFVALSPYIAGFALVEPFYINMTMIAAMLTIIGYSLNDTIVVFDRIRENRGKLAFATPEIMNDAINQTLSRTILTSSTALIAILVLYIVGGEAIRGFAYAMFIGVFTGTYSSIAVGSPLLLMGTPFANAPSRKQIAQSGQGGDQGGAPVTAR